MPSTVYKGDLAEVSFAPETGMMIRGETDARMTLTTVAGENITTTFQADLNKLIHANNDCRCKQRVKSLPNPSQKKFTIRYYEDSSAQWCF